MENNESFEKKLELLNDLVEKLQNENIPFEDSLRIYKDAVKLSNQLKLELENAISSINIIDENNNKEKI